MTQEQLRTLPDSPMFKVNMASDAKVDTVNQRLLRFLGPPPPPSSVVSSVQPISSAQVAPRARSDDGLDPALALPVQLGR